MFLEYLPEFLTIAGIHLLAVMSPGPDFAMICRQSLLYSRKTALLSAIGLGLGIAVHITYSLLGIGLLISQSILLFNTIKYLGAAYLIYIGIKSLISTSQHNKQSQTNTTINKKTVQKTDISNLKALQQGFLTNVLNPKATLFFLALFTQVIDVTTPLSIQLLYAFEMFSATILWFSFVAFVVSLPVIKKRFLKVTDWVEKITGGILILLGLKIALEKNS